MFLRNELEAANIGTRDCDTGETKRQNLSDRDL